MNNLVNFKFYTICKNTKIIIKKKKNFFFKSILKYNNLSFFFRKKIYNNFIVPLKFNYFFKYTKKLKIFFFAKFIFRFFNIVKMQFFFNFIKSIIKYLTYNFNKFFVFININFLWQNGLFFFIKNSKLFFSQNKFNILNKNKKKIYKNYIFLKKHNNYRLFNFVILKQKKSIIKLRALKLSFDINLTVYQYNKFIIFLTKRFNKISYYNFFFLFNKNLFKFSNMLNNFDINYFKLCSLNLNNSKIFINKNFYDIKIFIYKKMYQKVLKDIMISCPYIYFFKLKKDKITHKLYQFVVLKKNYVLNLKKKNNNTYLKYLNKKNFINYVCLLNYKIIFISYINFNKKLFNYKKFIKIFINFLKKRRKKNLSKLYYSKLYFIFLFKNNTLNIAKNKFYVKKFILFANILKKKWNLEKFFKINLRWVYCQTLLKLKNDFNFFFKKYFNFFFKNFYLHNNNFLFKNKSNILIFTNKKLNLLNINKFSFLFINKLKYYKKFNLLINTLYDFFMRVYKNTIFNISIFKYIFLYLKYFNMRKFNKYKYLNLNINLLKKIKLQRKKFINKFFNFYIAKRFFINKFNLLPFWKKIDINYLFSNQIRNYRFFQSHYIFYKKYNFNMFIFFLNLKFFFNKNFLKIFNNYFKNKIWLYSQNIFLKDVDILLKNKQLYIFFFKIKTFNLIDKKFIYIKNFLSWNINYFWNFYIIFYTFFKPKFLKENCTFDVNNINIYDTFTMFINKVISVDLKSFELNLFNFLNSLSFKDNLFSFNKFFQIFIKFFIKKYIYFYKKNWRELLYKYQYCFYFYRKIYKASYLIQKKKKDQITFFTKKNNNNLLFFKRWYRKIYMNIYSNFSTNNLLGLSKNFNNYKKFTKKSMLKLRIKYLFKYQRYLFLYNTCNYYNYFKRRILKKNNVFKFFFKYIKNKFKHDYQINNELIKRIGVISIVIHLNNTYITLTDLFGNVLLIRSGGLIGIKGPNRSTSVTSEEVTYNVCSFLKKINIKFLILKFTGVLYSRKIKAALKVFTFFKTFKILKVINNTPKSHNGIRLKKRKRL